jgi:hypothetical protein
MIFVNSMSDLFHKEIPKDFIDRVFDRRMFMWRFQHVAANHRCPGGWELRRQLCCPGWDFPNVLGLLALIYKKAAPSAQHVALDATPSEYAWK